MDIAAIQALYPLANLKMLSDIQRGRVERDYFKMLSTALANAFACEKCIVSSLGDIDNADMIAEVADLFLRDDKAVWTLCYGFLEGKMLLSIRNSEAGKKAGDVMKRIVSRMGTGGGHDTMAGGQISLDADGKKNRDQIEETVRKRFFKHVGVNAAKCESLVK
jgi:nanoRNase/pAp phosphatase (c-di-AMP/oligoRNAs hydrolase)